MMAMTERYAELRKIQIISGDFYQELLKNEESKKNLQSTVHC